MISIKEIEQQIDNIDWSMHHTNGFLDSNKIPFALKKLIMLDNPKDSEDVAGELINSIGNNHMGVYYPVAEKAIELIIFIEKASERETCKICAKAILNDLYYFKPELNMDTKYSAEEFECIMKKKLSAYSDESITF